MCLNIINEIRMNFKKLLKDSRIVRQSQETLPDNPSDNKFTDHNAKFVRLFYLKKEFYVSDVSIT